MTVRQSENGTWYVQCWVKDLQGRQVHKTKRGFETEEDALVWERKFREMAGSTVNLTFERFLELYEEDARAAFANTPGSTSSTSSRTRPSQPSGR